MLKILFILPKDNTYYYGGLFRKAITYAPLMFVTLASVTPKDIDVEYKMIDEGVQSPDYDNEEYDIVGITCVASSSPRAYELARYWRARGAYVVLGGAHPTLMPEEAAKHADSLFIGLAEKTWPQFLRDYLSKNVKRIYQNPQVCGETRESSCSRRDLLPNGKYISVPTVIASNGCKNNCEFCSIPKLYKKNGMRRRIGDLINEMKAIGGNRFLFLDPSLTSDREYAKELFEALIDMKVKWAGLSTIEVVNNKELFGLMVRSGCEGILIGFESFGQGNLDKAGKRFNQVSSYKGAIDKLHASGIPVLGCIVLGYDDDTVESLRKIPELVDEIGIDLPRFAVLTPFPGTELFNRFKRENRILTEDWGSYDTEHVVFQPKKMSPQELQTALYETWLRTYSIPKIMRRVFRAKKHRMLGLLSSMGFRYYARNLMKRGNIK
jgi:radical SAM superfamily enzyme YgiQ (UPF0313 family)